MKLTEKNIQKLKKEFFEWPATKSHNLTLNELHRGKAEAYLLLTNIVLTPHPIPMVNGLMIATMSSMVGVYAVKTLISDEYPVLITSHPIKLFEPTVLDEKSLIIKTWVTNNRKARSDVISVAAQIISYNGRLKAKCIFYYKIVPKETMEHRLLSLTKQ
ncbi:MAG: hypothetical protein UW30_C0002G0021 [Candidatus Giovannonibacteria bacterium GW2011_GWA2_44_13b]|uniref:Thioesterase domain-containing protein n=2 Tax=Candidatus Giovannoniibacteriota TaxID=1752738 RepID=A0A0G1H5P8_9BACT|nr:MAG: hypothetical protein UW30_C0002G0021 [Candidatus Giovannonibacteria bacterium GW2011_GWA2_44_13b]OGF81581.1 MAG: hypothetical protein A2924_02435 [Candidatus Giovannonibacteria bacterium RIFCSPLOWO2_01_FULL_44_16]